MSEEDCQLIPDVPAPDIFLSAGLLRTCEFADILGQLERVTLPKARRSLAYKHDGPEVPRGVMLGLVRSYTCKDPVVAKRSEQYGQLLRTATGLLKSVFPLASFSSYHSIGIE